MQREKFEIKADGRVPQHIIDLAIAAQPLREGDADQAMQIVEAAERLLTGDYDEEK